MASKVNISCYISKSIRTLGKGMRLLEGLPNFLQKKVQMQMCVHANSDNAVLIKL